MQNGWINLIGTTRINMVWLKKSWVWLKKNWKYVVTFGVPIFLSMIMNLIRSNRSLEKKVELKEQELELEKSATELENQLIDTAEQAKLDAIKKVLDEHKETLAALAVEERKRIESIGSAEEATEALQRKLEQLDKSQ